MFCVYSTCGICYHISKYFKGGTIVLHPKIIEQLEEEYGDLKRQAEKDDRAKLAYADARDKAQTYCDMSGLKLSRPLSVSEYSSTSSPRYSNAKMAYSAAESMDMVAYGTEIPSGNYSVYVNADCLFEAK